MTMARKRKEQDNLSPVEYLPESTVGDQPFRRAEVSREPVLAGFPVKPRGAEHAIHQRIAEKAHELYERRGQAHGHDLDDWLEAERLISKEMRSQDVTKAKRPQKRVVRPKKR